MTVLPFLGSWIVIGDVEVLRLLIVRSTVPLSMWVFCDCDKWAWLLLLFLFLLSLAFWQSQKAFLYRSVAWTSLRVVRWLSGWIPGCARHPHTSWLDPMGSTPRKTPSFWQLIFALRTRCCVEIEVPNPIHAFLISNPAIISYCNTLGLWEVALFILVGEIVLPS